MFEIIYLKSLNIANNATIHKFLPVFSSPNIVIYTGIIKKI